ncbi:MAG: GNAT family N-acetyltransferase [Candidatus Thermoplasmatota archaeon]
MSEVRIRPLEEKDIPRAVEIESAILGSKRSATLRGSLTAYLAKGDRNACLAAEMDGTLVGFLIGEVRTWDFGEDQEVGWIKIVGIDPAHQGKGIGKALGEALLKYFQEREIRTVRTAVDWDAADMIAYFRSLGFERSGHIGLEKELD